MSTEPETLQAKYRIPLGEQMANRLRDVLMEHPDHWLIVNGVFLEVHA